MALAKKEAELFEDKDTSRIFIGGFSQGCMVSLAAFLSWDLPTRLGGVLGLSGMQAMNLAEEHTSETAIKV